MSLTKEVQFASFLPGKKAPHMSTLRCLLGVGDDIKELAKTFNSLTRLDIEGSTLAPQQLHHLSRLKNLMELNLNKTSLGLMSLEGLISVPLKVLHLEYLPLQPPVTTTSKTKHKEELKKTPIFLISSLQSLHLSRSGISDNCLSESHNLMGIRYLDVSFTCLKDNSLEHLRDLIFLCDLNLFGCNINDDGIKNLQDLRNLSRLCLGSIAKDPFSHVTDKGIEYIQFMTSMQVLGLRNTKITDRSIDLITNNLALLRAIDLEGCPITNKSLSCISNLVNLNQLEVGNGDLTDDGYSHLLQLSRLEYLGHCYGMAVRSLEKFTNITALSLDKTWTTAEALLYVAKLPRLSALSLRDCDWINQECLEHLRKMTGLQKLYVGENWKSNHSEYLHDGLACLRVIQDPHRFMLTI